MAKKTAVLVALRPRTDGSLAVVGTADLSVVDVAEARTEV